MKIQLHDEQRIVEIFSNAIRLYRQHSQVMLPLAMLVVPFGVGMGYLAERTPSILGTPLQFASFSLINALSAGGIMHVVDRSRLGEVATLGDALHAVAQRSGRLITTQVLALFMKILTILIFPYFLVRWWFTTQAVMLEDARGWGALTTSSDVVIGRWWRAAGVLSIIVFCQWALVLTSLLIVRTGAPPDPVFWRILVALIVAAWNPLVVCAETALYLDLRARAVTVKLWSSTS